MDAALERADWDGFEERRKASAANGKLRGLGLAYYVEVCSGRANEETHIKFGKNGRVTVLIGTQSTGQGHETAWAQIIGEKLGLDASVIDFPPGDSDLLPDGGGTGGSRSLIMGHRVFFKAADDIVENGTGDAIEKVLPQLRSWAAETKS